MKVLMVMQHVNFFRNLDTVLRELHARGHEVVMLHGTNLDDPKVRKKFERQKQTMVFKGRGIQAAQSEFPGVTVGYRPEPDEPWHEKLRVGRQVINYGIYLRKGHPAPDRVVDMIDRKVSPEIQKAIRTRASRAVLARRFTLTAWRWLEAATRPSRDITKVIKKIRPDIMLVSPSVWPKDPVEADYIRAARALRIPTIGYVNSWDNLTSKGTLHVVPDVLMVWNEPLAKEAVEIHDIPRKIIRITGAPHLDRFFEMRPTLSRADICTHMGCPADKPYMVYLCTSRTLIRNELHIVTALAEALARQFPDGAPTLVVRPHPTNSPPWDNYAHPGVTIYPKLGDQADTPESWQEYYNQLSAATCVFGLNTTAFLESVVANRPCLTIVSDELYETQGKTGHFRHLLAADFMEVSRDVTEVAARVARILDGADEKVEGRRYFTEWFLRPCGVGRPATLAVVDVIEQMALKGVRYAAPVVDRNAASDLLLAAEDGSR